MSDLTDTFSGVISDVEDQTIAANNRTLPKPDQSEATDAQLEEIRSRILNLPSWQENSKTELNLNIKKKEKKSEVNQPELPQDPEGSKTSSSVNVERKARKISIEKKLIRKAKGRSLKVTLNFESGSEEISKGVAEPSLKSLSPHTNHKLEKFLSGHSSQIQTLNPEGSSILEELVRLKNPPLVEQLLDLYTLLYLKNDGFSSEEREKIFNFGKQFALKANKSNCPLMLGKLILVVDNHNKNELLSAIKDEITFIPWITTKFTEILTHSFRRLNELKHSHKKTGLQDPNVCFRNNLPVTLANLIISSTGRINFGILAEIANEMQTHHIFPQQYKQNLFRFLEDLKAKHNLREQFNSITGLGNEKAPASIVIRSCLKMKADEPITPLHAKRCAFAALASHLRQGSDGSCFATPLEIVLLSSRPELCLNDFSSLLEFNKLTRQTNRITRDFPFLLRMSGNRLEKIISLSKQGRINPETQPEGYLFEAPGIIAACRAIGINSPKKAILEILQTHFNATEDSLIKLSLKQLLEKLVLSAKSQECNNDVGIGTLFVRASFAYESQEVNPLLQVWENAIAGMAEPDETGMVLSAIIDSVLSTLKIQLKELYPSNNGLRKLMEKEISKELGERVHLQYDPVIASKEDSEDRRSKDGAFVLYDKHPKNNLQDWVRVDNPHVFQDFIYQVVKNSKDALLQESKKMTSNESEIVKRAMDKLGLFISTDYFIISALRQYYERNKEFPEPMKQYEDIKYAPWVTKSGNDFSKVIQVYFEAFNASKSIPFTPKNVKDLLIKVIDIGKSVKNHEKEKLDHPPHQLMPVRIQGVHAFNILLTHPSMAKIWNQSDAFSHWLNKKFLLPGKQTAEAALNPEAKSKVLQAIIKEIIPEEMEERVANVMNKFEDELPIREFREKIINLLSPLFTEEQITKEELCDQVDMLLLDNLPEKIKLRVKESALHFADTNWSDGIHDIHLCFLVNPGTGDLEIWAAYDDNQKFFPISKNQWISGKKWEFFIEVSCDFSSCLANENQKEKGNNHW